MITADQIPPEVMEAGAKLLAATNGWKHDNAVDICKPVVLEIIAAAIAAWPGMEQRVWWNPGGPQIILPLPQEPDA